MDTFGQASRDYLKKLDARKYRSRVYTSYQLIGLEIAELLEDRGHKSLYIHLAKKQNPQKLLELARSIAERSAIDNKGAYFMKVLHKKE